MLILYSTNKRICLLCGVLFLVLAVMVIFSSRVAVAEEGAFERNGFSLYADASRVTEEGGGILYICAQAHSQGGRGGKGVLAMALQFSLVVSEGWGFGAVTACGWAEGMTVTVGRDGSRLHILIDGYVEDTLGETGDGDEGVPSRCFLQIELIPLSAHPGDRRVQMEAEGCLYYIDEKYEIDSLPIGWEESSTGLGDDISTDTSFDTSTALPETQTEGVSESHPVETAESSSAESSSAETAESSFAEWDTAEPPPAVEGQYIGCQETKVTAGEYAVRFLFHGATPVFCAEGGGQLAMEITAEGQICAWGEQESTVYEGDFFVCTFRGLRAEGRYVFRVFAHGTWVRVIYDGGRFLGYSDK
jgi:hypothetical protein